MTCILVAHLGYQVIIAADKRVTHITPDGVRTAVGDNEEKIVRTEAGVITGAGSVAMLDYVKGAVSALGFNSPDEVLDLILDTRESYSKEHADSPRLQSDLAETSWMFTYPMIQNDQPVTRFVCFHQSLSTDSLVRLDVGRVMCFPGGFSLEEAQVVQAKLQRVVDESLNLYSAEVVIQMVVSKMISLMAEISEISESVSSISDIALIDGRNVNIAMSVSSDAQAILFTPMAHALAQ